MKVVTFKEAKKHDRSNIRKILELAIFVRPAQDDSTPVTAIWGPDGLIVPTDLQPIGLTTKDDGATWTRSQETSETTSHGYAQPTRIDVVSDVSGLTFTGQESKRTVMEVYHDLDLSGVTTDADGNFYFDKPDRPSQRRWEVWGIGKDGAGPDAIYTARILPEAQITEMQDQAWTEGDETKYPCTMTGYVHEGWGTSLREIWGGPGLDHEAMGFPAPASG
ncbi:hypothetical protein K0651_01855 [Ornithinimicrobium sp. Arc0846-15]|nr:hypothetical protein [Ornithinimicrobium laminariae]